MAFPLGRRGADAIAGALNQAVENKQARQETSATSLIENGVPIRFAGEAITRNMGMNGDFGRMTGDKRDKESQRYMKEWVSQWTNGFASPMNNGGPLPEEVA